MTGRLVWDMRWTSPSQMEVNKVTEMNGSVVTCSCCMVGGLFPIMARRQFPLKRATLKSRNVVANRKRYLNVSIILK